MRSNTCTVQRRSGLRVRLFGLLNKAFVLIGHCSAGVDVADNFPPLPRSIFPYHTRLAWVLD